ALTGSRGEGSLRMRPNRGLRKVDPLHPLWVTAFVVLVGAWAVAWGTGLALRLPHPLARVLGYGALLAMLVPYVHIVRRFRRFRRGGSMAVWLRLHILAAYLAFGLLLLHCRGRASGWFTLALLILFWLVMLSGAVGYYGQKVLYRLMPDMIKREV